MGRALVVRSEISTNTLNNNAFSVMGNAAQSSAAPESSRANWTVSVAGTISHYAGYGDTTTGPGTTCAASTRKNGGAGNLSLSFPNNAITVVADDTHSDTVAANDTIDCGFTIGSGTFRLPWSRYVWKPTSGHSIPFTNSSVVANTNAGTTNYLSPVGRAAQSTTESTVQFLARTPATLQNLQFLVDVATNSVNATFKTRVNTADPSGNLSLTISSGATGVIIDSSHTVSINSGDVWNFALVVPAGSGAVYPWVDGCDVVTSNGTSQNDIGAAWDTAATRAASGTMSFYPISGGGVASTPEAAVQITHGFYVNTSNLRMQVSVNSYTGNATLSLRINGANATQTKTISASATGVIEDSSHADAFTPADASSIGVVGGTSGSITIPWYALTETDLTDIVVQPIGQHVSHFRQAVNRAGSF